MRRVRPGFPVMVPIIAKEGIDALRATPTVLNQNALDTTFLYCRNVDMNATEPDVRYADMFAALGAEPRLRIVRLLLSAHPDGLVVSEIQAETGVAGSTLSHHLEKLKNDELVTAEREKAFIRYRANTRCSKSSGFLYAECCTRNKAVEPKKNRDRGDEGEPS